MDQALYTVSPQLLNIVLIKIVPIQDQARGPALPNININGIKKDEALEKTEGGLILSGSAKERPQQAVVVAVGPGTEDEKMQLKEGDHVIFSRYGGTDLKHEGVEYTIMEQKDILAVIE